MSATRRAIPAILLLCAWAILAATPAFGADTDKPNIVFILVDDMGRDWLSCYGATHATPNIDKLASQGVRFENAWCTPLCTPTRVMLLTGQYPFRSGWTKHYDVPRWGGRGFDPEKFTTIARVLRDAGYATAIAGKWQINDLRIDTDIMRKHGFNEHCLWTGVESGNKASNHRYWDAFLQTNGDRKTHEGKFGPDLVHAFVADFIMRHKDAPFFVYYPMIQVHSPHEANPLSKDNPPKGEDALYAGNVTHMDYQVGLLLKQLDDLNIAQNTVVVFAGDNGSSSAGKLNGKKTPAAKGKTSNLGVNVPLIVRAPKIAEAGREADALVDFTDIFPTLAQLAGAALPNNVRLDGRSMLPLLKGTAAAGDRREWIFSQLGNNRTVRNRRFKLDSSGAFFDLQNDPLEKNDLRDSSDGEAISARKRLAEVLSGMPADAAAPFPEFAANRDDGKKKNKK